MLNDSSQVCSFISRNSIQLLHLHPSHSTSSSISDIVPFCSSSAVMIQTEECSDGPPPIAASTAVLIFAFSVGFHHLEQLQMTCYPFVGVWCHLDASRIVFDNVTKLFSEICDAFLIVHETFAFIEQHVVLRKSGVTAFTLRRPTGVCNKAGVFNFDGRFQKSFTNLNLTALGVDFTVYNGPPVPAKSISLSQVGVVQGFEYGMTQEVARFLNFSSVDSSEHSQYGIKPDPQTYWGGTILHKLVTRRVHFVYGDLSIIHPRELYFDFTYVHDIDVAAFHAKVDVKPYSGSQLFHLIGHAASATFIVCVLVMSLWFTVYGLCRRNYGRRLRLRRFFLEFAESLWYFGSFVLQPRREIYKTFTKLRLTDVVRVRTATKGEPSRTLDSAKLNMSKRTCANEYQVVFLLIIWNFAMLVLGRCFECKLISFITIPTVQGKCDTFREISQVLSSVPRARIYTADNFKLIFDRTVADLPKGRLEHRLQLYMDAYEFDEYVDYWRKSRVAFIFAESLHTRRLVWKYNMGDFSYQVRQNAYNVYQAIAFQKGCLLRQVMSGVIQTLVETGHVINFKRNGGIYLSNKVRMPLLERPLMLDSFASMVLTMVIAYGTSIVLLLAEIFNEYQFIRPTMRSENSVDVKTVVDYMRRQHNNWSTDKVFESLKIDHGKEDGRRET